MQLDPAGSRNFPTERNVGSRPAHCFGTFRLSYAATAAHPISACGGVRKPFVLLRPSLLLSLTSHETVGDAGVILSAFGSWMQALWDHGGPDGPSILFQPMELLATVEAW